MKWIGQHIWDYISRFRNDVYLEDISTGTIASGGNLGLDSNNKIVKAAEVGSSVDLTSEVTGTLPVANGGTGATSLADNSILTGTGTSPITAEADLTWSGSNLTLSKSTSGGGPTMTFSNSNADEYGSFLYFVKTQNGADGDDLATIGFQGKDAGGGVHVFSKIKAEIETAAAGQECGKLSFYITEYDGTGTTAGLVLTGQDQDGEIDVTIGAGAASTTTIAGDLTTSGEDILFKSTTSVHPVVELRNTTDDAGGPFIKLNNTHAGNDGADGDFCGTIQFYGMDDGIPTETMYGDIHTRIHDATSTEESGIMYFRVANHDGGIGTGLTLTGGSENNEIDVQVGLGAASVTTIAGDLDIDGDNMTSAGAMTFTPVGKYTIAAPDLSDVVFHLDANADTDNVVDIDAGALDIDATAAITIDAATSISINSGHNIDIESGRSQINKIYDFHATTFENRYAADTASGTIIKYSPADNTALNGSEIYYLRTNGAWAQAQADNAATSSGLIGIGLGAPQTNGILLKGFVAVASTEILNTPGSGNVDGLPVYLSDTTAGHFDFTAPSSSGDIVRIVGYAIDDHLGMVLIYFDPDKTWVEIA